MMMKTTRYFLLAGVAALVFATGASAQDSGSPGAGNVDQPQVAQPQDGGVNWKDVGVGAGTAAGNLVYVPLKLAYGILGGIAGGAGYALTGGNKDVADSIWRSSLGGDYVLTPDMIKGQKPIYFSGPSTTATNPDNSSSSSSPANTQAASSAPISPMPDTSATSPAAHPIDNGAGPVNNMNSTPMPDPPAAAPTSPLSSSNSARGMGPAQKAPPLPDTSIE